MRQTPWLWIMFVVCLLLPGVARADGAAPVKVQRAAEAGLPEYLAALPEDGLADYGFHSMEEARQATLGQPYRIYILPLSALTSDLSEQSLVSRLQLTDMWLYPVLVEEEPHTMLLVDRMPDGYRAVQLGNTVLPPMLATWEARLPGQAEQRNLGSYEVRFVRMPQAYSDFLLVTAADREYVAPLHLAPDLGHLPADQLQPVGDVVSALSGILSREGILPDKSSGPAGGVGVQPQQTTSTTLIWAFAGAALMLAAAACTLLLRSQVSHGR